jgi:hypothetical protein
MGFNSAFKGLTALNSASYFEVRINIGGIRKHNCKVKVFKEKELRNLYSRKHF